MQVIGFILGLGILGIAIVFGAFLLAGILGLGLVLAAIVYVRLWWFRRQLRRRTSTDEEFIETEYEVLRNPKDSQR